MMPAGTYYVGDLCYVMDDDEWDEFCTLTIKDNECLEGEFELDGRKFATYGTKWGDGEYRDQNGHSYGVDAGLIGCIRLSDIKDPDYDEIGRLGNIVVFEKDFTTSGGRNGVREWNGKIHIGHIVIDTDADVNCDYTDEYEYGDY